MEPAPVMDGTGSCEGRCEGNTRRAVLMGLGLAGVGGVLVGCSSSDADDPATGTTDPGTSQGGQPSSAAGNAPAASGKVLGEAAAIPVGGGVVFKNAKVIVTQPTKGVFKAWSNVCTHSGCAIDKVAGGTMNCPCHGSKFAVADASVTAGPAPAPLEAKKIKVVGGKITLLS
jgi:Rieske Fe-S protein